MVYAIARPFGGPRVGSEGQFVLTANFNKLIILVNC